jgi:hypothetical protein
VSVICKRAGNSTALLSPPADGEICNPALHSRTPNSSARSSLEPARQGPASTAGAEKASSARDHRPTRLGLRIPVSLCPLLL